jgi:hypothetical protein
LYNAGNSTTVYRSFFLSNSVWGASASTRPGAGAAGNGEGGGLHNTGSIRITQTTFVGNSATGGGGSIKEGVSFPVNFGAGGNGSGGAIYNTGTLSVTNVTVAHNRAEPGPGAYFAFLNMTGPGGSAFGGGILNASVAVLADTIIAFSVGPNCGGSVGDGGHNISSDSSCSFTAGGSRNDTDPLLGPPADNGGQTLTMSLLPGSPAINAGSEDNCGGTDQRGVPRPAHGRCDIGAYELVLNEFRFTLIAKRPEGIQLRGYGPPGFFAVEGCSELGQWNEVMDGNVQSTMVFELLVPINEALQFFRTAQPDPARRSR